MGAVSAKSLMPGKGRSKTERERGTVQGLKLSAERIDMQHVQGQAQRPWSAESRNHRKAATAQKAKAQVNYMQKIRIHKNIVK